MNFIKFLKFVKCSFSNYVPYLSNVERRSTLILRRRWLSPLKFFKAFDPCRKLRRKRSELVPHWSASGAYEGWSIRQGPGQFGSSTASVLAML